MSDAVHAVFGTHQFDVMNVKILMNEIGSNPQIPHADDHCNRELFGVAHIQDEQPATECIPYDAQAPYPTGLQVECEACKKWRALPDVWARRREHAVGGRFTCAAARVFMGTYYSSFSDAIQRLRLARGDAHPEDEHNLKPPPWDQVQLGHTSDMSVALDDPALTALLRLLSHHHHDLGAAHAAWLAEGWGGGGANPLDSHGWVPAGALSAERAQQ